MKIYIRIAWCVLMVIPFVANVRADDLPRHGVVGLTVAAVDPALPEDQRTNPLTVKSVAPGSAGEAAGIQPGDIIREMDGASVSSSADFAIRMSHHLAGDHVPILIVRGGQELTKTAILKPRPYETSPDADLIYSSVSVEGARRRVIVTRPQAQGRYPAVIIMSGLGCYSVDGPLNPYAGVVGALAKHSIVTMRVEKTGQGDSEGPACTDLKATAELEADGYAAGLAALRGYDFVDPGKIFIFAHSLGPLVGALILPHEQVRGFIAAETVGRSWFEYGLENMRRQSALIGEPLDQVDDDVRLHEKCAHDFYVLHHTSDEVSKTAPQCADMIRSYAGVPYTFMQQIGDINLARQWKQVDIPVLVIYGGSDPVTSEDESRYLVDMINSFHPGRATYVELPGMGHDFNKYDSGLDFMARRNNPSKPHPFDTELTDAIVKWLDQHLPS